MKKIEISSIAKDISGEIKTEQKKITTKQIREILSESIDKDKGIQDIVEYIDAGGELACVTNKNLTSSKLLDEQLTMKNIPHALLRFSNKNEMMFIIKSIHSEEVRSIMYNSQILINLISNAPNKEYEQALSKYICQGGKLSNINLSYGVDKNVFEKNLSHHNIPYAVYSNKAINSYTYIIRESDFYTVNSIYNQLAKRLK